MSTDNNTKSTAERVEIDRTVYKGKLKDIGGNGKKAIPRFSGSRYARRENPKVHPNGEISELPSCPLAVLPLKQNDAGIISGIDDV